MKTIDVRDDDDALIALTDAIQQSGEAITLMRGGRAVADVLPRQQVTLSAQEREKLFDEVDALRKTLPRITMEEIQSAKEEGRR